MQDKAGAPYILHPLRVMQSISFSHDRSVNKTHAQMAALLHDVLEDHGDVWPVSRLRQQGIPEEVITALDALTKRPKEIKPAAARRAAANPIARLVKLADVADNMDVWRFKSPDDWDLDRLKLYQEVRDILESSFLKQNGRK
jgi:guanosine-3',5'-bis(diphosphate) 3'-pyrophosphohydrolase